MMPSNHPAISRLKSLKADSQNRNILLPIDLPTRPSALHYFVEKENAYSAQLYPVASPHRSKGTVAGLKANIKPGLTQRHQPGLPQRHRITGNTAVVEKGQKGNAVYKACRKGAAGKGLPQRHRIAEFAAVAAKGNEGNAVYKARRMGTAGKGLPQRHRIAEFAAVAAKG